jgi:predicted nucleic acid-binding protein
LSTYADTSFIASLYLSDSNSNDAAAQMAELRTPVLLSSLGELELMNALQLHLFRKEIREPDLRAALAAFRADVDSGILVVRPVTDAIYTEARALSIRWTSRLGARSLDILQVAAAMIFGADSFLTFDDRQKKLAKAAGLVCR